MKIRWVIVPRLGSPREYALTSKLIFSEDVEVEHHHVSCSALLSGEGENLQVVGGVGIIFTPKDRACITGQMME
jgi:hypothetical protein